MNFTIVRSDPIRVSDVKVSAPSDSPNTDGIHITHPKMKEIIVVCDPSYQDIFEDAKEHILVDLKFALPGNERRDCVYSGLEAIDPDSELVYIHDSARPLVSAGDVTKFFSPRPACIFNRK